jgi:hypothetical protein
VLRNIVSIISTPVYLVENNLINRSDDGLLTEGVITIIAEPEPDIPDDLAPLTNASLVIFLAIESEVMATIARPFQVNATSSCPS